MGAGVGNDAPDIGPEQDPSYMQGEAPAGLDMGDADNPVRSVSSPPATFGGFSPEPAQEPLPPAGSGIQKP